MPCPFSEKFLQVIWNDHMLTPRPRCTDGTPLRVLSSGLWNRGKGPDFSGAALLLGERLRRGAVEVHRLASEWFTHGHDRDPAYAEVILHVVWEDDLAGADRATGLPTLELNRRLHAGWRKLLAEVENAFYSHAQEVAPGACALRWALTKDEDLRQILAAAGWARFSRHGQELLRQCAERGEEQALYETVFDGLGYAANRRPFRMLAQAMPLASLAPDTPPDHLLAAFLGRAGLLPDPTREEILPAFAAWLGDAWKYWWSTGLESLDLPWAPFGGRPLNSVHRRLAAGVFWLVECQCRPAAWLRQTARDHAGAPRRLLRRLLAPAPEPPFWRGIRDFHTAVQPPAALLGRERRADLALNIWLPYLGAVAEMEDDARLLADVRDAWMSLPRGQENHLLRDAAHRFLTPPSRERQLLRKAAQQQGIMDVFRNFCLALNHNCNDCPFVVPALPPPPAADAPPATQA